MRVLGISIFWRQIGVIVVTDFRCKIALARNKVLGEDAVGRVVGVANALAFGIHDLDHVAYIVVGEKSLATVGVVD